MQRFLLILSGGAAGLISGLFGAGGGMVLVPLLSLLQKGKDSSLFSGCLSVILPICTVSLLFSLNSLSGVWRNALPYCLGGIIGAIPAVLWGKKIPTPWLHRLLGCWMLWGGLRYLLC